MYLSTLPPQLNDDDGTPLVGGLLHTRASGTTTPQATYLDKDGDGTNENPIVLDGGGRYVMWLDPALEYDFFLTRADESTVKSFEDYYGVPSAAGIVTSVNELTGDVELTAEDVEYTPVTSAPFMAGKADVAAALDAIGDQVDSGIMAGSVGLLDAAGNFGTDNVEYAIATLAAKLKSRGSNATDAVTTNTTMAASTPIAVPVTPGNYKIDGHVSFGGAGGIKLGLVYSGTTSNEAVIVTSKVNGGSITATDAAALASPMFTAAATQASTATGPDWVHFSGSITFATGGTLTLYRAQNSSSGTQTIAAGAYLALQEV